MNPNMLQTYSLFNRLGTQHHKLYDISQNTERKINTAHDIRFNIGKQDDTRKITCPLDLVQHIFLLILFLLACQNGDICAVVE